MPYKNVLVVDWLAIQNVESSFLLACQQPLPPFPYDFSDRKSFFVYLSQVKDQSALQFIAFLRQIKEFEALDKDDRFTLIKYNFLSICILHECHTFNRQIGPLWDLPNVDINMYHQFLTFLRYYVFLSLPCFS
jgi:hypothetical protein